MAAYTHTIKQGDTEPVLRATLYNPDSSVLNLAGITSLKFSMGDLYGNTVLNKVTATVIDAANGIVQYAWAANDTATTGSYLGEFVVTDSGGGVQRYPNGDYIAVNISPKVA